MVSHSRRGYLQALFIGGATLVAGCTGVEDDTEDDEEPAETDDTNDNDGRDEEPEPEEAEDEETPDDEATEDEQAEENETDDEDVEDEDPENLVIVAPDGDWRFEPEEITIEVGETVTWYFEASGHNVTSHPDASDFVENPEDAEPITSYDGDDHMALDDPGTTHERTFEVPGEYVYVCTPHEATMIGTVIVEG